MHAEGNAIISASRNEMIGATLYLVGKEFKTSDYIYNANSCDMCKRLIINSGIEKVIVRDNDTEYRIINVTDWITDDDTLSYDI